MIPAQIYNGVPSPGEQEVFQRFKTSSGADDWIVLHSLDIAHHVRQVAGEADFVVIIPNEGVLCLEVKACRDLFRSGDGWYYGSEREPDPRGPFKQASEAMHSIRKSLIARRPDLAHVLFWSAVVFPYLTFSQKSDEWHQWQVIDAPALNTKTIPQWLLTVFQSARAFLSQQRAGSWLATQAPRLSPQQAIDIAGILRPLFEVHETPRMRNGRWSREVRQYTEEQFLALDAMDSNPRVLFTGPAGTGKTLLAIETARRDAAANRRVLLLCFNRLLGKWLQEQSSLMSPNITASTFHALLLSITGAPPPFDAGSIYWEEDLPDQAIESLIENECPSEPFDSLVIDEAQDLLKPKYLEVLDLLLRGGLSAGRLRLFGDMERQVIFRSGSSSPVEHLSAAAGYVPQFSLRINCRNSPRIAALVRLLGGLTPDYTRVMRPDNGIEPDVFYFKNRDHQVDLFLRTLTCLYDQGIRGNDIVVLSPKADKHALVTQIASVQWRSRLKPVSEVTEGYVGYGSIHAFKGLEAPAVILTDIDHLTTNTVADLFYVGVTRALHHLTILVSEDSRADVIRLLTSISSL